MTIMLHYESSSSSWLTVFVMMSTFATMGASKHTITIKDPPQSDKKVREREEVNKIVPFKAKQKRSCWDKSKTHHSFEESEQTSLCQMCHSEPAGFKASSHLERELTALAPHHTRCHILLPLSLPPYTVLSLFLCFPYSLISCHTWP